MSEIPVDNPLVDASSSVASWLTKQVLRLPPGTRSLLRIEPLSLIGFTDERKSSNGNQDRIAVAYSAAEDRSSNWLLAVVCDGVGGSSHSERAASNVIASLILDATSLVPSTSATRALKTMLQQAHVKTAAAFHLKSSTTAVALLVRGNEAAIGWVGDSRAYELSEGNSTLLTCDDTLRSAVARAEPELSFELNDEFADHLSQAIGGENPVNANVVEWKPASLNSTCLLCTDGVWKPLGKAMDTLVNVAREGSEQMRRVLLVSEWFGGIDNASAVLVPPMQTITEFMGNPANATPKDSIVVYLPGNVQTLLVSSFTSGERDVKQMRDRNPESRYSKSRIGKKKKSASKSSAGLAKGGQKAEGQLSSGQLVILEEPLDEAPTQTPAAVSSHKPPT